MCLQCGALLPEGYAAALRLLSLSGRLRRSKLDESVENHEHATVPGVWQRLHTRLLGPAFVHFEAALASGL